MTHFRMQSFSQGIKKGLTGNRSVKVSRKGWLAERTASPLSACCHEGDRGGGQNRGANVQGQKGGISRRNQWRGAGEFVSPSVQRRAHTEWQLECQTDECQLECQPENSSRIKGIRAALHGAYRVPARVPDRVAAWELVAYTRHYSGTSRRIRTRLGQYVALHQWPSVNVAPGVTTISTGGSMREEFQLRNESYQIRHYNVIFLSLHYFYISGHQLRTLYPSNVHLSKIRVI